MAWSIALRETHLNVGILDDIYFGEDAAHSYLVLIDPQGGVAAELHGLSCDPVTGEKSLHGMGLPNFLDILADTARIDRLFERAVDATHYAVNRLRVVIQDSPGSLTRFDHHDPLIEGGEDDMLRRWIAGCMAGLAINQANLVYKPFSFYDQSVNCNAVSGTLARLMTGAAPCETRTRFATHGLNSDLGLRIPALAGILPPAGPLEALRPLYAGLRARFQTNVAIRRDPPAPALPIATLEIG